MLWDGMMVINLKWQYSSQNILVNGCTQNFQCVDPHWFQYGSWSSILRLCGSRSRGLMPKNLKKFTAKKILFYWSKIALFLIFSLGLNIGHHVVLTKLHEMPLALNREHPAFQNMKFLHFLYLCGSFLPPWFRIQPTKINADSNPQHYNFQQQQKFNILSTNPLTWSTVTLVDNFMFGLEAFNKFWEHILVNR